MNTTPIPAEIVELMAEYEDGSIEYPDYLKLFSFLIRTGHFATLLRRRFSKRLRNCLYSTCVEIYRWITTHFLPIERKSTLVLTLPWCSFYLK
jgi:hypothetical protein